MQYSTIELKGKTMKKIKALDCTLRDGGYCNHWNFKENNIKRIIEGLISAKVEIIECGFLTDKIVYSPDVTCYTDVSQLQNFIPIHDDNTKFVVMVNYGEYDVEKVPEQSQTRIDGIRVAFHKTKWRRALEMCKSLQDKGYLVFLQPMVTMSYTDEELIELLQTANALKPCAFYIVDSFGTMNRKDLRHYYDLVDYMLDAKIGIGFHSHNNLQSAFANAQSLLEKVTDRTLYIDSSIYGMGRGAGNLNSELFLNELNSEFEKNYDIKPLLQIMDEILNRFYEESPWGYSLPNYLSAAHMVHPNYAKYLMEKNTLLLADIDEIFSMIDKDKRVEFDEKYISNLYLQYMSTGVIQNGHLYEIKEKTKGRNILIIAPGKSANDNVAQIKECCLKENPIVISVNYEHPLIPIDYIFVSNIRRFRQLDSRQYSKTISTSNIKSRDTYTSVDYYRLLNTNESVRDNAGLMAIKFVIDELDICNIFIAGLDGYEKDVSMNYENENLVFSMSADIMAKTNDGMVRVLKEYSKIKKINFVTTTRLKV